jgi:hypothetical protein
MNKLRKSKVCTCTDLFFNLLLHNYVAILCVSGGGGVIPTVAPKCFTALGLLQGSLYYIFCMVLFCSGV